ncbi:MAG: ABC transporter permease [Halanaeroarchaeum sp.]
MPSTLSVPFHGPWSAVNRRRVFVRVAVAILTIYAALSVLFVLVTLAPNTDLAGKLGNAAYAGANVTELRQMAESYRAARGLDRPIYVRYVGWLVDMTTLHWGASFTLGAPVVDLVADRLERTLAYALPGLGLSIALSVVSGLYVANRRGSLGDTLLRLGGYFVFGLPNFWIAALLLAVTTAASLDHALPPIVYQRVLPALLLGTMLFAGQLSYVRSGVLEQTGRDYLQFLRAKGLSKRAVSWRLLRNVAAPLVTVFFADLLDVFVVAIYVIEFVFQIPGIGSLTWTAVRNRDMPLLLGTAIVIVVAGVLANLVQDLTYGSLDPRTERGES